MYTLTDQPLANTTNHDDPVVCTVECQTYVTVESLEAREKELAEKRLELLELQAKVSLTGLSKDEFAKNEAMTKFYRCLPNFWYCCRCLIFVSLGYIKLTGQHQLNLNNLF